MQVGVLLISSVLANLQKDEEYRYKMKWMTEGALAAHSVNSNVLRKEQNIDNSMEGEIYYIYRRACGERSTNRRFC